MKNRKFAFILLPLTLVIWGAVVFKVLEAFDNTEYQNSEAKRDLESVTEVVAEVDTFSLLLNYTDPFLPAKKKSSPVPISVKLSHVQPKEIARPVPQPTVEPLEWPQVEYMGFIENKKSKNMIAMIKIGGNDQLLDEGQEAYGVKVLTVLVDSVKLDYQRQVKFIKRIR